MLLITQERASPGSIVSAAALPGSQGLLTASDAAVACYRLPPQTTAAAAAATEPAPQRLWQQPVSGGRVELAVPLTPDCLAYLLVTSHGTAAPTQAAVVQVLNDSGGSRAQQQQQLGSRGSCQPRHHVCTQVDLDCEEHREQPPTQPAFSSLMDCGGGAFILAASLHEGTLHVLHVQQGPGGTWQLAATPNHLCDLLPIEPGEKQDGRAAAAAGIAAGWGRMPQLETPLCNPLASVHACRRGGGG